MGLVEPLFEGAVDVVGDIHGEIEALRELLRHLGYAHDGREHPAGRRLVFVGDLCDRGPDSPAVVSLVAELVRAGAAQCILGNHELNVLRGVYKHGNAWITDPDHAENRAAYACVLASRDQRTTFAAFFRTLPLALERADLRVVHASWHDDAIATVRASTDDNITTFARLEEATNAELATLEPARRRALDPHRAHLHDEAYAMPHLPDVGSYEEKKQTLNAVRTITSGFERATTKPFFATEKWRFCDRVRWWKEYAAATPVIFGHYWRVAGTSGGKPDLFAEYAIEQWQGNAYCVDFSVGGRFRERRAGTTPFAGRLAAVRWPERTVMFDDGSCLEMR